MGPCSSRPSSPSPSPTPSHSPTSTPLRSRPRPQPKRRSIGLGFAPRQSQVRDSDPIEMFDLAILRNYASLPRPGARLPGNVHLLSTRQALVIFDAYPKAKYHFLVLPRVPFFGVGDGGRGDGAGEDEEGEGEEDGASDDAGAGAATRVDQGKGKGKATASSTMVNASASSRTKHEGIVRADHLADLPSLMRRGSTHARREVIAALKDAAEQVVEMIRDEMVKSEGYEWGVNVGFHAMPSMTHLHLHVISDDLVSPALKVKKHYNSFRPDLGFFVHLSDVERWLDMDAEALRERVDSLASMHPLLSSQLTCYKCDEPFGNMPKLKTHLEGEFASERKKGLQRAERRAERGSESD